MKCPNCGFVSYTGVDQCKKCNYPFVKSEPQESTSILTSLFSDEMNEETSAQEVIQLETGKVNVHPELDFPSQGPLITASKPESRPTLQISPPKNPADEIRSKANEAPESWREELSDRVLSFRKRRGRQPPEDEIRGNLELEFEDSSKPIDSHIISGPQVATENVDSDFDVELGKHPYSLENDTLSHEKQQFHELGEDLHLDAAPEDTDEMSLGEHFEKSPPMEIVVGPPAGYPREEDADALTLFYAPLSRRMMAGFTDALILTLGAALFSGIFWYSMTRFCDHATLVPLSLGILGLVALILIFGYFSIFTVLTSATPGLLWMGCEIRNLRGENPTLHESLWRAFGVLVSLSALMVGFIWAYVDSESLTWHDRMSGTMITESNPAADLASLKAED